jgi:hypothetical protein
MDNAKKGVIVYVDWIEQFEYLTDVEAGKLIKHFFRYVNNLNPVAPDRFTEMSFIPIKRTLKRDLENWENTLNVRSKAGKESVKARKLLKQAKQNLTKSTHAECVNENLTKLTDSVSVSVSVSEKEEIPSLPKPSEQVEFTIEHCLTVALNDNRWVKANAATRTELMAFNEMLEQRGVYQKNPGDYKTHYSNWVKTKLKTHTITPEFKTMSLSPPLKRANFN